MLIILGYFQFTQQQKKFNVLNGILSKRLSMSTHSTIFPWFQKGRTISQIFYYYKFNLPNSHLHYIYSGLGEGSLFSTWNKLHQYLFLLLLFFFSQTRSAIIIITGTISILNFITWKMVYAFLGFLRAIGIIGKFWYLIPTSGPLNI